MVTTEEPFASLPTAIEPKALSRPSNPSQMLKGSSALPTSTSTSGPLPAPKADVESTSSAQLLGPSPSPPASIFASPALYLNQPLLPPLSPYGTSPGALPLADSTTPSDGLDSASRSGGLPEHSLSPKSAGAPSSAHRSPQPLPIIQFDPNASPSDGDDDDDDDDNRQSGIQGRPKKRKSVANLRGAAGAAPAIANNATASSASGSVSGSKDLLDDDDKEDRGRRKIQIEYIEEKSKRHITFSKRKAGIMKKAYELSTLTGTQVLLLVVSESGWVYTFTTDKFKPLVKEDEHGQLSQGQKLIAACLEARDGDSPNLSPEFPPNASTQNFEANSAIHGGQIALKTNRGSGGMAGRPTATNRRVSSKGRNHIPGPIRTDNHHIPGGPLSGGSSGGDSRIPPVPQLPSPMSAYLDPLNSPISPRGPRSHSHTPVSPGNMRAGMQAMQQAQSHAHMIAQNQGLTGGTGQGGLGADYQEMLQKAEFLQMQQQGGYGDQNGFPEMYGGAQTSTMGGQHLGLLALHDPPQHLHQHLNVQTHPHEVQQYHAHPHPQRHDSLYGSIDPSQQQQQQQHHHHHYANVNDSQQQQHHQLHLQQQQQVRNMHMQQQSGGYTLSDENDYLSLTQDR